MSPRRFSDSVYHSSQLSHHRHLLAKLVTTALPQVPQGFEQELSPLALNVLSQSPPEMSFSDTSSGPSSFNLVSPIGRSSVATTSTWSERSSTSAIETPHLSNTCMESIRFDQPYMQSSTMESEMPQFLSMLPSCPIVNPGGGSIGSSGEDPVMWNQPWMGNAWAGPSVPQYPMNYDSNTFPALASSGVTDPMQATFPQNYAYLTAALYSLNSINPQNLTYYQNVSESPFRSVSPVAASTPAESTHPSPNPDVAPKPRRYSESVTQSASKKGRKRKSLCSADTSELTKGMDKKDRRRMQNRLAQRAFRARSKLQQGQM